MQLSHFFLATISTTVVPYPLAVASILAEDDRANRGAAPGPPAGLDEGLPIAVVHHSRHLHQAIIATIVARACPSSAEYSAWPILGAALLAGEQGAEIRKLTQHIALAGLVPFRVGPGAARSLQSLQAISRTMGASTFISSVRGEPVLVITAPGGAVVFGYRSTVERLNVSQVPAVVPGPSSASIFSRTAW